MGVGLAARCRPARAGPRGAATGDLRARRVDPRDRDAHRSDADHRAGHRTSGAPAAAGPDGRHRRGDRTHRGNAERRGTPLRTTLRQLPWRRRPRPAADPHDEPFVHRSPTPPVSSHCTPADTQMRHTRIACAPDTAATAPIAAPAPLGSPRRPATPPCPPCAPCRTTGRTRGPYTRTPPRRPCRNHRNARAAARA